MLVKVVFFVSGICSVAFLAVLPSITVILSLALLLLTVLAVAIVVRQKFAGRIDTGGTGFTFPTNGALAGLSARLPVWVISGCFIHGILSLLVPLCLFAAGFVYASAYATYQLSLRLPEELLGTEVNLAATVKGLPFHNGTRLQFLCEIEILQHAENLPENFVEPVHGLSLIHI